MNKLMALATGHASSIRCDFLVIIYRLYQLTKTSQLPMPAINIHDSVVKVSALIIFTKVVITLL